MRVFRYIFIFLSLVFLTITVQAQRGGGGKGYSNHSNSSHTGSVSKGYNHYHSSYPSSKGYHQSYRYYDRGYYHRTYWGRPYRGYYYHGPGYWSYGGWWGWGWGSWWGPFGYWGLGVTLVGLPYYWTVVDGCYFYDGFYYRRSGNVYVIVNPPVGAVISDPAPDQVSNKEAKKAKDKIQKEGIQVSLSGTNYWIFNGVYYELIDSVNKAYKIAGTDEPLIDPANPEVKYVKINDLYYEKQVNPKNEQEVTYIKAASKIQKMDLQPLDESKKPADAKTLEDDPQDE